MRSVGDVGVLHPVHRERLARLVARDVEHAVVVHRDQAHVLVTRHRRIAGAATSFSQSLCVAPQPSATVILS